MKLRTEDCFKFTDKELGYFADYQQRCLGIGQQNKELLGDAENGSMAIGDDLDNRNSEL